MEIPGGIDSRSVVISQFMTTRVVNRSADVFLSRVRCLFFFALTAVFSVLTGADSSSIAKRSRVNPILRHTIAGVGGEAKLPGGLSLVDWEQIKAEYERHRHGMFPDGKGGYHSRSHYHGWLVRFDGKGFEVDPDTESWTWGLDLVSWGREGKQSLVSGRAAIHKDVNRLEYRRKGITEWFENGKEGLEHGFTIAERPEGENGELRIALRQRGGLAAELNAGGRDVTYKTAQGDPALRYRKLVVTDARGRRLPARMVADGQWLRILVDDRWAVYPIVVDPIAQQAYLKASNTGAGDDFGISVAISGDTVVVGARFEDSNATGVNGTESNNSAGSSGAAYVFVRSSGTWSQQAYLKASNTEANDQFGYAEDSNATVAISGDTVVVVAPYEASNATGVTNGTGGSADNSAGASGAAYVFTEGPDVTSISPTSGPLAGGQSVTITGTNFTGATAVTIGGAAVLSFTVVSATSITATTPAGTAGTASVLVTTPSGTNSANTLYTYQATPTVTAISPSSGSSAGGQSVTITGTNFTGSYGGHHWRRGGDGCDGSERDLDHGDDARGYGGDGQRAGDNPWRNE